jgi:hypothetical protein
MAKEIPQHSSIPEVTRKFKVIFGQMGSGKQECSLGVES